MPQHFSFKTLCALKVSVTPGKAFFLLTVPIANNCSLFELLPPNDEFVQVIVLLLLLDLLQVLDHLLEPRIAPSESGALQRLRKEKNIAATFP